MTSRALARRVAECVADAVGWLTAVVAPRRVRVPALRLPNHAERPAIRRGRDAPGLVGLPGDWTPMTGSEP